MRIRRAFNIEFKREIAELIVSGKATQLELSRKYNISPVIISRWKKEYYSGKFFENKSTDYARFEIRVKELSLGEGSIKTLVKHLKITNMIMTSNAGTILTKRGEKLYQHYLSLSYL